MPRRRGVRLGVGAPIRATRGVCATLFAACKRSCRSLSAFSLSLAIATASRIVNHCSAAQVLIRTFDLRLSIELFICSSALLVAKILLTNREEDACEQSILDLLEDRCNVTSPPNSASQCASTLVTTDMYCLAVKINSVRSLIS